MLLKKVLNAVNEYGMFCNSKQVTVALSGGADSVTLLCALCTLKNELGIKISAAHLNHCLRGAESDRDEAFVTDLCKKLDVPLYTERADINKEREKTGESTELCARRVRYEFLNRVSNGGVVATAHTASDSAETVLLNLTRGTGIKGLCGIPPVRDNFVRPLIYVTRAEVEEYCKKNSLEYVTDSTNLTDDYTRNKIRHNAVPVLSEINPSFESAVTRASKQLAEIEDFLNVYAEKIYNALKINDGLKTEGLVNEHPAVCKKVIVKFLKNNGIEANAVNIEQIISILNGGKVTLPQKRVLKVKNGVLKFENTLPLTDFSVEYTVISKEEYQKNIKVNTLLLKNTLDYDKISGEVEFRARIPGDKIRLSGRGVTKTLKKLYTESSVPLNIREKLPVLSDCNGPIWVYGFGIAERVKIDDGTEKILLVKSQIIGG